MVPSAFERGVSWTMNRESPTAIAGLSISAPATWKFHEFENLVLARRDSPGGNLQLSLAYRSDCREEPTPERSEACARRWLSRRTIGEFEVRPVGSGEEWLGSAAVGPQGREGRVWFVLRDGQLLLGLYLWAKERRDDPRFAGEIDEAEAIVRSARWEQR